MTEEAEVQPAGDSKSKFAEAADDGKVLDLEAQSGGGSGPKLMQGVGTMELEPPDKASSGLLFDIDPQDPAVMVALFVGVVFLAATLLYSRRRRRGRPNGGSGGGGGDTSGAADPQASASKKSPRSPVVSRYNTRGHRVAIPRSGSRSKSRASPGKVVILTPPQVALCEVLYDVYGGTVPSRGIETKTVEECGLSVSVGAVPLLEVFCWCVLA